MTYQELYANFLKKFLKPQKPLKVVFDCSNGTTGIILGKLFQLNVESKKIKGDKLKTNSLINYKLINEIPDGNFPAHSPNPLDRNVLGDLKFAMRKNKADLGVIFDADGDRTFFIDDKLRLIDPQEIAHLLIWHLRPKKIIIEPRIGYLINKGIDPKIKISLSRVGHYFFKIKMRKENADFGCERSGHIFLKKFFYADTGILTAIEVINAISKLPYKFSDFIDLLPKYYDTGEINIKHKLKINEFKKILDKVKKIYSLDNKYKILNTNQLDGLTMKFNDHWFNIRPSNTEPVVRIVVEAIDRQTLAKEKKKLLDTIRKFIEINRN